MKIVRILLALALATLASAVNAADKKWDKWGAAPYASSQQEACKKASVAIDGLTRMPVPAREAFKKMLGATCEGGKVVWLTPDLLIEQMWSGGSRPHVMERAAIAELPVLKSPDGRPYRKGSVAETAKALQWSYAYNGETYILYLPFVCFNWSWTTAPVPLVKKCVELGFNAPVGGKVSWNVTNTSGPFSPPDACNAQQQGNGPWVTWYGECEVCTLDLAYVRGVLGDSVQVAHKYLYSVTEQRQTLRFSPEVRAGVVSICLEDAAGRKTCGVYMRPEDWKGRYRVEIPDALWLWDDGNCPSPK